MHGEGFGVSPDVCVSGACVPPRAFSDSMSNGPGDLLGINHTSLHPVLQELGASLTCRVLAYTALLINACRIGPREKPNEHCSSAPVTTLVISQFMDYTLL